MHICSKHFLHTCKWGLRKSGHLHERAIVPCKRHKRQDIHRQPMPCESQYVGYAWKPRKRLFSKTSFSQVASDSEKPQKRLRTKTSPAIACARTSIWKVIVLSVLFHLLPHKPSMVSCVDAKKMRPKMMQLLRYSWWWHAEVANSRGYLFHPVTNFFNLKFWIWNVICCFALEVYSDVLNWLYNLNCEFDL